MTDISTLNTRFGLPEKLLFKLVGNDMPVVEVNTSLCAARIALQGAQVLEWTPVGEQPVVWLSKDASFVQGKSIRGGVPLCWPWFGAHSDKPDFPAHGFARTVPWQVVATESLPDGRIKLIFALLVSKFTHSLWPYDTPLELHITLGNTLELELITHNNDKQPITITEALHTYFAVGDVRRVSVVGLDGCDYLDKVEDFARHTQQGAITFNAEVDRVYLNTETKCVINDATWQRQIHISKRSSHSTVVWNPWLEKAMAMGIWASRVIYLCSVLKRPMPLKMW